MANIVTAALDGTGNVTAANSGANNLAGTAGNGTYVTSGQIEGTSYMQVATSASLFSLRWDYTAAATAWHTFYFFVPATAPAANLTVAEWRTGTTTKVGDLRLSTGLVPSLRDSTGVARYTGSALTAGAWIRVAIRVTATDAATGHQLRLYVGANLHGSVPDFDSGSVAVTGTFTGSDAIVIGNITSTTVTTGFDRLLSDNATEPAGLSSGSQFLYPASDTVTSGWTVTGGTGTFASAIDETSADDSDFCTSPATPSASVLETPLGAGTDPGVDTGHVLDYRIRTSGAASSTVVAALYQGATLIASETRTGVPAGFTTFTFNIPSGSIAAITNYAALRFRVTATAA